MVRAFALTVLITLLAASHAARAETITLVGDLWCPYNCDPASPQPGFMVEITQRAFARHGITVKYKLLPWTRAVEATRSNRYTALVGAAHQDAPDFVFPASPQGWIENAFYVKKDSDWRFTDMTSLATVSLGFTAGYSYNEVLDTYIAEHKNSLRHIQPISGDEALAVNVKKLLFGRIGAVVEGRYVMDYYLAQQKLIDRVAYAGSLPASDNDRLYIAFSPNHPQAKRYAEILTKETLAMHGSGELEKLLHSYQVRDWHHPHAKGHDHAH